MTEPTAELPPFPDLERILQAPVVTFLARVEEVQLGDVVDSLGGPVRVREIVQRRHQWDLAGDQPGHIYRGRRSVEEIAPLIRRSLPYTDTIRVRRPVTSFGRLKGHSKNVHSHAPVKRGWYTDPGGYDAECSCGWKSPELYASQGGAGYGWLAHKAGQLTEAAYADNSALLFLDSVQVVHPSLPALPWIFRKITHGPRNGGGYAEASLDLLSVELAREALAAWRTVPDLEDVEVYEEHRDGPIHGPWGDRPGYTSLRQIANGPGKCHLVWDAHIQDAPIPPSGEPQ